MITRYYPPRIKGSVKHMPMDRGARGPFVLYSDHLIKLAEKDAIIKGLQDALRGD